MCVLLLYYYCYYCYATPYVLLVPVASNDASWPGSKWNLKMLMDVLQANKARENSSVSSVQQTLRRLASNRGKISKERLLEFVAADPELSESDIDQVLGAVGMGGAKLLDCDQLATKLLDRVCNPPSVLEMHDATA